MTFQKSDILLPKTDDLTSWSVVACDQYTSQMDYWQEVEKITDNKLSTYHLVLPEIYLEEDNVSARIKNINDNMISYVNNNIFNEYKSSYIYVERVQKNKKVRKGIMGQIDLEDYDYNKGSKSRVRATEGTVTERIPPRLKVRIGAKLELPHIMLLIDDAKKTIIEEVGNHKDEFEKIYDFDLMMDSGHITGYLVNEKWSDFLTDSLEKLSDIDTFNSKYGVNEESPLVYAVGDGNHSLATAKEYYNTMKSQGKDTSLSRYALAELVNLHDESLVFEAIHRVVFDVNVKDFVSELSLICDEGKKENAQAFTLVTKDGEKEFSFKNPTSNLTVGTIEKFINDYIAKKGGRVDYIHGDDVVRDLSSSDKNVGIILDAMDKNDLFKSVVIDGALPRKTFSMGDAYDKRFYTEARIINDTI